MAEIALLMCTLKRQCRYNKCMLVKRPWTDHRDTKLLVVSTMCTLDWAQPGFSPSVALQFLYTKVPWWSAEFLFVFPRGHPSVHFYQQKANWDLANITENTFVHLNHLAPDAKTEHPSNEKSIVATSLTLCTERIWQLKPNKANYINLYIDNANND